MKSKKTCAIGANCKSTCIDKGKNCLISKEIPKVAMAVAKINGTVPLPKGLESISWGRMKLVTSGHEKLIEKADIVLMSKASESHVKKLRELFPDKKFESAEKGVFNYLAKYDQPIPNVILGSDNKELGDNLLKNKLAKKITYIDRLENSVSSSEARLLFSQGRTPQQMVDLGFFTTIPQAEYGFERWKDGF